jgi:signal peptidase II
MNVFKNFKNNIISKEAAASTIITILIFTLDRISKISILNHQANSSTSLFVNDYLNFDLIWNTGISFGLFSQNANIFYHITSLIIFLIIVFLIYLIIRADVLEKILFSFILGGALGNFFDRLIYFAVPDFIDIHIGDFHWFTFNIADIFITTGVILLISKELFMSKK